MFWICDSDIQQKWHCRSHLPSTSSFGYTIWGHAVMLMNVWDILREQQWSVAETISQSYSSYMYMWQGRVAWHSQGSLKKLNEQKSCCINVFSDLANTKFTKQNCRPACSRATRTGLILVTTFSNLLIKLPGCYVREFSPDPLFGPSDSPTGS